MLFLPSAQILALQKRLAAALTDEPQTAAALAASLDAPQDSFTAWKILEHLAANGRIHRVREAGSSPLTSRYTR